MNPQDALKLAYPQAVMIQTTSRCNAACVMCPHPQIAKTMPQGNMEDKLFDKLIEELAAYPKLKRVMLYLMNEPLLDKQLVPRIKTARAAMPEVEIYIVSNGATLTKEKSEELLDAGLTWIGFSLHAITPETYKAVTGRGDFFRVRSRIVHHVEAMLNKHGSDSVMINITRIRPHVDDEEWEKAIQFWQDKGVTRLDLTEGYISRAGNVKVYDHEPVRHQAILGCKTVWAYEMAHVLFDGAVIPCCMDYRRQAVWGNVSDQSLLDVWRGNARSEFLACMDGRDLPDDFLCGHCEDAVPAKKIRTVLARSEKEKEPTAKEVEVENVPDILLVHTPPWLTTGPPLGIAALTAWLERDGFRVEVRDVNIELFHNMPAAQRRLWEWEEGQVWERDRDVERLFGDQLRQAAKEIAAHPTAVIGISLASRKELAAALLVKEIHRLAPEKHLVVGGPATATREERDRFFKLSGGAVKLFVVGEGELTLSALLRTLHDGQNAEGLPGVAAYGEGQIVFNEQETLVTLASLPTPDYRHFDLDLYGHPALFVEWSRGCTGNCVFCNVRRYWQRYRYKPTNVVLRELADLIERHEVKWLSLADPVINGNPKVLEQICDGIVEQKLELKWSAGISPNHELTAAQFVKLARAGCYRLEFGVESGSDRILNSMKKRYTAAQAIRMCRFASEAGIDVVLYLIVGFPGETEEDFAATLRAVEQLAPYAKLVRSVNSLLLIPGSELCDRPEHWGIEKIDHNARGWERRWQTGSLSVEERVKRTDQLTDKLKELKVPVEFSNRDEIISDQHRHSDQIDDLYNRVDDFSQRLQKIEARARRLLDESPGLPQVTLAICPVWGIDAPPYGLASLAAATGAKGYRVKVRDFNIESYNRVSEELRRFWEEDSFRHWTDLADWKHLLPHLEDAFESITRELLSDDSRVIGFSVYSPNRRFTIEICRRIKQADPGKVIVIGGRGVHTSQERLLFPPDSVDYFVVGEGEETLAELLAAISTGKDGATLPGIVRFEGHHLTELSPKPLIKDLGSLPHPTFDGFDLRAYRSDELPLLATRGCIGHCTFCNDHPAMGPFRARPGHDVAQEILSHQQRLGVSGFRFNDQLINGDLNQLEEMCDALIAADVDVKWIALAAPRGDMKDELLRKMRRAGCYTLNLGIESGSDEVLRKMAKGYRVTDIETSLRQLREADINTMVNFIVGFPGETEEDFAQTLSFAKRNRENICGVTSINTCLMLLGSPLEKNKNQFGIVVPTGAEPDTSWVQGENTPNLRQQWAKRLLSLLEELGLSIRVSNLHEKAADIRSLPEKRAELAPEPLASPAQKGQADQRKGIPFYESLDAQDVDVLLIMPPVWGIDVPPLGIAYMKHYLVNHGVTAQCLDLNIKLYNRAPDPDLWRMDSYKHWTDPKMFPQTLAALSDLIDHYVTQISNHPAKYVGLSLNTGNFAFGRVFARRLKSERPERPIILGGPGVTNSFDIATLSTDEADYLVLGEGERSGLALVQGLLDGHVPEIDGVLPVGGLIDLEHLPHPIQEDLSRIGWPKLLDFNFAEYATDAIPILGSRGCIRRCTFCNDHHIYRKFRKREAESIVEEILWHAERGHERFTFHDVLINGDVPVLERMSDLLIASGKKLQWGGQGVIRKEMTQELFEKMARAGCQSFVFGVESFSNKVLKAMNKPYTYDEAQRVLAACHAAGIETIINLITGFPGEGEKEFRETYDFVRDHGDIIDQVASITPCLVNLGSRMFEKYEEYGIRFSQEEGSIKWWSDDGNTFEERRRRVLALTTMLARREQSAHTVNLYDEKPGSLPQIELDDLPPPVDGWCEDETAAEQPRPDIMLALPPPWGVDFPPLGLATLAGSLRNDGFTVAVRDLNIEWYEVCGETRRDYWKLENLKFWTKEGRLDEIIDFLRPQIDQFVQQVDQLGAPVIGFSTNESNLPLAVALGKMVKEKVPDILVVLGGPGVHWQADRERIGHDAADLFVVGEGEITLAEVLRRIAADQNPTQLSGTVAWRDGQWLHGPDRKQIQNLDDLPDPDYSDLSLASYRTNEMPLMAGRGCINRCAFCNDHLMVPGYRSVSPQRLFEQVVRLRQKYGATAFTFNDLLLNANLPNLRRFCELVIESGQQIFWTGQAVVRSDMTADDFDLFKKSGCVSLVFGVESFADDVLRLMNKRFDAATTARVLKNAKDAGIETLINLIVGFPGESEESFDKTCDFIKKHHDLIDRVSAVSTCIVVAQCALEKDPEKFGIVLPKPEHWCQWHSADDSNSYQVRVKRLRKLVMILQEKGIPHSMTNLYREALESVS